MPSILRIATAALLCVVVTCGESSTGPNAAVAIVGISPLLMHLQIGDTVRVHATARRSDGSVVDEATITWYSLDAAHASVTPDGLLQGLAEGEARVVAVAGRASDTLRVIVERRILATTAQITLDTLDYLDATADIAASSVDDRGERQGHYTAVVRNAAVVRLVRTDTTGTFMIAARANGSTHVVVQERYGTMDSVAITVRQRVARLGLSTSRAGFVGETRPLSIGAFDAANKPVDSPALEWVSSDTLVALVDLDERLVRLREKGSAVIGIRSPDGPRASAEVEALASDLRMADSMMLGVGQSGEVRISTTGPAAPDPLWVEAADPAIADVTILGTTLTFVARTVGTTTFRAGAPGFPEDTIRLDVIPVRMSLTHFHLFLPGADDLIMVGESGSLFVAIVDTLGVMRPIQDHVPLGLEVSDPSILEIINAPGTTTISASHPRLAITVRGLAPGGAFVRVTAPDFPPDSIAFRVIPGPKLAFLEGNVRTIGARLSTQSPQGGLPFRIGVLSGARSDLAIQLTRSAPWVAELPSTVSLPAAKVLAEYDVTGLAPGVDTIIATASGYEPDTLVLHVTTPHLLVREVQPVGWATSPPAVQIAIGDSAGNVWAPLDTIRVEATSSDPSILQVFDLEFVPGTFQSRWLKSIAHDTGEVAVTVSTTVPGMSSRSAVLRVRLDSTLRVFERDGPAWFALGQRQRLPQGLLLQRGGQNPGPIEVRLISSDPSIVASPELVTYPGTLLFLDLVAGDRTGIATISVEAHGYAPLTAARVDVGVPYLTLNAPRETREGTVVGIGIGAHDHWGRNQYVDEDLELTFVSSDESIVLHDDPVIPGGTSIITVRADMGRAGVHRLAFVDQRGAAYRYRGDTALIQVKARSVLAAGLTDTLTLGDAIRIGLRLGEDDEPEWSYAITASPGLELRSDAGEPVRRVLALRSDRAVPIRVRALKPGRQWLTLLSPHGSPTTFEIHVRE